MSNFAKFKERMKNGYSEVVKSSFEEGKGYDDPRYWKVELDKKTNTFSGLIRFLPPGNDEEVPFAKIISYSWQNKVNNQWFIENSPASIGLPCPVQEDSYALFNEGTPEAKNKAKSRGYRQQFIMNILVIEDGTNPENNGKVFLFKCNKTIYNKIMDAINPKFAGDKPIDPFDIFTENGADFKMRVSIDPSSKLPTYDGCSFASPSKLFDGDETKLEEVYNNLYSVAAEVEPSKFKTYDELKARFLLVEGKAKPQQQSTIEDKQEYYANSESTPKVEQNTGFEDDDDDDLPPELKELLNSD